jgi:hypothetical protein
VGNRTRVQALRDRAEHCQQAVATFMRIQEELIALHKASAVGAARDRITAMLTLNQGTMDAVRRSLAIAETELRRAES